MRLTGNVAQAGQKKMHKNFGREYLRKNIYSGWTTKRSGVRVPVGYKCSLLHIVQTGSGVHPTSYKMGTGGSFPGVKQQGREADHSPPTSAEVKKIWIYTSTPPYVFMA
jgi:hypothetical protein